MTSQQRWY